MLFDYPQIRLLLGQAWLAFLLSLLVAIVIGLTASRTYRQYSVPNRDFDWSHRGMSDFHNGTYYPTLAFANGDNPYAASVRDKYPMARQSPIYSPIVFWIHLPVVLFEVATADVVFFIYNAMLLALLAWLAIHFAIPRAIAVGDRGVALSAERIGSVHCWNAFLLTWLFLLVSRPGHITLFTGYFTLELVIGSVLAVYFGKSKPSLSGVGILLASGKPTYVIPLILLLLAQRRFKAVFIGLTLSFIAGMSGLMWLAAHSDWSAVIEGIKQGQAGLHADPTELPIHSWTRVDTLALVAKCLQWAPDDKVYLLAMVAMIGAVSWWLSPTPVVNQPMSPDGDEARVDSWQTLLVLLTMTISIYHHSYDVLLIVVPMFALMFSPGSQLTAADRRLRWFLFLLCSVPFWNLLSTQSIRDRMQWTSQSIPWQAITMVNGFCLAIATVTLLVVLTKARRQAMQLKTPNGN